MKYIFMVEERQMDQAAYQKNLSEREEGFEGICAKCGLCCGADDGDPCSQLAENSTGVYFCRIYDKRLGPQYTKSGKLFTCVPILDLIRDKCLRPECAYNKVSSSCGRAL